LSKNPNRGETLDLKRLEFTNNILKRLKDRREETLNSLSEGEEPTEEDLRKSRELVRIMNNGGNKRAAYILKEATDILERAIKPQWPYNFKDGLLIEHCTQIYDEALRYAILMHTCDWEFILQEGAKSVYSSKLQENFDYIIDVAKRFKNLNPGGG